MHSEGRTQWNCRIPESDFPYSTRVFESNKFHNVENLARPPTNAQDGAVKSHGLRDPA